MSDYTIDNKPSTPNVMVRRAGDGSFVEIEVSRDAYVVPPAGEYRLRVTGYAKPFQMTSAEYGESTNTRVEFEIVSERGRGHKFTDLYTWTVGPKSNLGALIRRARGIEIPEGNVSMGQLLLPDPPVELTAYVSNSDKLDDQGRPRYAKVVLDSVKPATAKAAFDPFEPVAKTA